MVWIAVQTAYNDIHIYPIPEAGEHILDPALCNCMPEVYNTAAGRLVVHRKIGSKQPLNAHWIGR